MSVETAHAVGRRVAYQRRMARLTQEQLAAAAGIHVGSLRKIERGARGASETVLDALAAALGVDVLRLHGNREHASSRVRDEMPALSAVLAGFDWPDEGPVRPLHQLRKGTANLAEWRLGAQYLRVARQAPGLLAELLRALHTAPGNETAQITHLLVSACRSADAVAYKYGAPDLSARIIDIMRWAAPRAENALLDATVAYVRAETFFAAQAHAAGLRMLERALDESPAPRDTRTRASRGALHMRAAVMAGRDGNSSSAIDHMERASLLAHQVAEGVYQGTAFGPASLIVHKVSLSVSLGGDHVPRALEISRNGTPPTDLPAERRSSFYIELARAQLWAGLPDQAFDSLKAARHVAPQHTRAMVDAPVDGAGIRVPLYVGASDPVRPPPITYRRGRHRRPRTALGRLWGRVVSGREGQPVRTETAAKR
ncbi:helix-turn-helix domain-containing protein [Streptomyces xiamenensis]|uniref:helix-turn-helix domain-containing protein n=1 Tax=Streptomyces xiamenensis TaxID=408015 RepID=UPI0035E07B9F